MPGLEKGFPALEEAIKSAASWTAHSVGVREHAAFWHPLTAHPHLSSALPRP